MSIISDARKYRAMFLKMRDSSSDATASVCAILYPVLKQDGSLIKSGTRINWNGIVKKAAVDLWDTTDNNPDNAPTLWVDLDYREGYRIIPEVITVTEAFAQGERGWWMDDLYESLLPSNTYNPTVYAAGWKLVE